MTDHYNAREALKRYKAEIASRERRGVGVPTWMRGRLMHAEQELNDRFTDTLGEDSGAKADGFGMPWYGWCAIAAPTLILVAIGLKWWLS